MDIENSRFKRLSFQSYPKELESERAAFLNFIEESGANAMLIEAISLIFKTVEKPDNPMQWLKMYFKNLLLSEVPEEEEDEGAETEDSLKEEIIQQESKLTCLQVETHRLEDRLLMLGLKAQHIEFRSPIITNEEEYRRYKDLPDDLRWRIKPDPAFRVTKSDVMLHVQANEEFQKRATMHPGERASLKYAKENVANNNPQDNYDDYTLLYFASNDVPQPPPPTTAEPEDFESEVVTTDMNQRGRESLTLSQNKSQQGRSTTNAKSEVLNDFTRRSQEEEVRQPKPLSRDSKDGKIKKKVTGTAYESVGRGSAGNDEGNRPLPARTESMSEKQFTKFLRKSDSRKSLSVRKSTVVTDELGGDEPKNDLPYTPDPMLEFKEPIDSSYWLCDFNPNSHASYDDRAFSAEDEDEQIVYTDTENYEDEDEDIDVDEEGQQNDSDLYYISFTGAKKQRKFRSQIITEKFWKPDRGMSIHLDSQYDLHLHEHLGKVGREFDSKFPNIGSNEDLQKENPSTIGAELSDNSIVARVMSNQQAGGKQTGK